MTHQSTTDGDSTSQSVEGESLAAELQRLTGIDPARCYQCGKCTAGCPMSGEMSTGPQLLIRLVQLDKRERVEKDESIWLCLTCETCTSRCPNDVDPARLIDGLREIVWRGSKEAAPKRIRAFHEAFLEQIQSRGRIYELGLVMDFKSRTFALLDDAASAPLLLARGKLKLFPSTIYDVENVQRIFATCLDPKEQE